jgi:hypothetical protein
MYADDIILLSSSANGLQEKLDILSKYGQYIKNKNYDI